MPIGYAPIRSAGPLSNGEVVRWPAGRSTMTHDQDQITEQHPRDLEIAEKILKPRRDRAERAYDRALTTLWVGNAGAALATLA